MIGGSRVESRRCQSSCVIQPAQPHLGVERVPAVKRHEQYDRHEDGRGASLSAPSGLGFGREQFDVKKRAGAAKRKAGAEA
jgi:hypothetical protein